MLSKPILTPAASPIRLKRLNLGTGALFCALYNEIFRSVSGALEMDENALAALLRSVSKEAGFLMLAGIPLGVYVLDLAEPPLIVAVGLREEHRGRGYGSPSLAALENRLVELGFGNAALFAAKNNVPALALYRKCGYRP